MNTRSISADEGPGVRGPCVLVIKRGDEGAIQIENLPQPPVTLCAVGVIRGGGGGHERRRATLVAIDGSWGVCPAEDSEVRVNGLSIAAPRVLSPGDRIGIDDLQLLFYPQPGRVCSLGGDPDGFARARFHLARALEQTDDDERDFIEALADIEQAVDQAEKRAIFTGVIPLMNDEKWSAALVLLEDITRHQPEHARAWFYKAICQVNMSDVASAVQSHEWAKRCCDDAELQKEIDALAKQLDMAKSHAAINDALEALGRDDPARAVRLFASLPPELREEPQIKLFYCLARVKDAMRYPGGLRGAVHSIRLDLQDVARRASSPDVRQQANSLLRQLQQVP